MSVYWRSRLLEDAEENEKRANAERAAGRLRSARTCCLLAARDFLRLAKEFSGESRKNFLEKSSRLQSMASSIGDSPDRNEVDIKSTAKSNGGKPPENGHFQITQSPNVHFDDIAGLNDVKEMIRTRIIYPFKHPEVSQRFNKRPGGGLLLFGPPGTGKTMIGKAAATELEAVFFTARCSDIISKWLGDSEKNIRKLFEAAHASGKAVVFLDEVEALIPKRGSDTDAMNRLVPEFLALMDGIDSKSGNILLIGATNRPWDMDEAALREGRFGDKVYIGLPDQAARLFILNRALKGIPIEPGTQLEDLAQKLEGYSGADITGFCRVATDQPYLRQIQTGIDQMATALDFDTAFSKIKPAVDRQYLLRYQQFMTP